jgi:beta-glucuronidase
METLKMTLDLPMLYPQSNRFRQKTDLSGYWDFCLDPDGSGVQEDWPSGFVGRPVAVPASWNDQLSDTRDYFGAAWYQTYFNRPWGWEGKQIILRFGSVNYLAQVWLNGHHLGTHEGGHLPFEFNATPYLQAEDNLLVVRVDGSLAPDRVPPGNIDENPLDTHQIGNLPRTTYDFFPFCGIHRRVWLYALPDVAIADLTVATVIDGSNGRVQVELTVGSWQSRDDAAAHSDMITARFTLHGHGRRISAEATVATSTLTADLTVPNAALWSPDAPNLYNLTVELLRAEQVFDRYSLPVGIRSIQVRGDRLLLNGTPIMLTGFGRHEDFPITGRGTVPAVNIKDYALMSWIGANSFRTSHYPYDEEMLSLADRLGFMVISETPAVGLYFQEEGLSRRQELCRQYIRELIARDKNHPSVIMWSLANEPRSVRPSAVPFFRNLCDLAKSLDTTRPITIVSDLYTQEESLAFCDVVCVNVYRGWYQESGDLVAGFEEFARILDETHAKFGKPVLVAEFGADAIPGHHALPPEMFSEEYQAEMLAGYIEIMKARPFVTGQHVWNLCDFKTAQGLKRPQALNLKGVFTRDRRPKLAAHRLRALWKTETLVQDSHALGETHV